MFAQNTKAKDEATIAHNLSLPASQKPIKLPLVIVPLLLPEKLEDAKQTHTHTPIELFRLINLRDSRPSKTQYIP